ncbi:hypothetical protein DL546_005798 [Coniochaeta pulveracea]|uniref:Asl1-like glycosyl hydrolase catalytic domain-containing protein n=1 Tax=Coniochaeta pulveracea TaxID=177199 RepID=A0A420YGG8_9PEZI|nr:hypothetical protein DL546_005798 [Coniochaeta pulveracea]
MLSKNILFLAVASLAKDAVAVNMHRNGHQHLHKKDLKVETDFETVTDWVTVTVYDGAAATSAAPVAAVSVQSIAADRNQLPASSVPTPASVAPVAESTSVAPVPQTTLITAVKPSEVQNAAPTADVPVPTTTSEAPAPVPTTSSVVPVVEPTTQATSAAATTTAVSSSGKKRGLAYNNKELLSGFLGGNSKVSWAYGWNQVQDFSSDLGIEFVPMLWGPRDDFTSSWADNAKKAIANGATALLSFNEPDNGGQANISPSVAAAAHIQYMNPFAGQARISTPAITNSGADGEGISWLQEFISACGGKCSYDFAAVHWYSNNGDDFLSHLEAVHNATGLPVWVTEFAPIGTEVGDYATWVAQVCHTIDTDPKYDFVERYSYFMVAEGNTVEGGQPNALGKAFAFTQ